MNRKKLLILYIFFLICLLCGCQQPNGIPGQQVVTIPESSLPSMETEHSPDLPTTGTDSETQPEAVTHPSPGVHTLENLLRTALLPVGNTMYIWGGGWNEEDTGAGIEAVSFGVSPKWKEFADRQDSDYNVKEHRYQIHDGLDCSGYVGWIIYNVMETEENKEGYVTKSTDTAGHLANLGLGDFYDTNREKTFLCGDIVSMKGHVWISLGTCADSSVLLLHSSPPGVRFSGTRLPDGSQSQAVSLAQQVMETYYPDWYARYPACDVSADYLENVSLLRITDTVFPDADKLRALSPEELVTFLFERKNDNE